ncbi:MAG TPA: M64 family metallopeptidase, partial [Planctomycetota bacterium]|nr:M64 family metallopeptidase [Planctomycetota bacterium]
RTSPQGLAIVNGRDSNRLSITSLAEGFTVEKNEEQEAYDRWADREMKILEKTDFFKEYDGYLNYYSINLWSKDRGLSREPGGIHKDTPCGGKIDGGVYTVSNGMVRDFLQRFPGPSIGNVIGNDNANVATGGGGCTAIVKGMLEVVGHEDGHAFGGVGDEYDMDPSGKPNGGATGRSKTPLPTTVIASDLVGGNNKDEIRKMAPWAHWIALGPGPTAPPGAPGNWTGKIVDIFEGGNRTPWDVWRPQSDCKMRSSGSPYCCVCMEQMVLHLYDTVRPIDEVDPKEDEVECDKSGIILKAFCLRPRSRALDATWDIRSLGDEEKQTEGTVVRASQKTKKIDRVDQRDQPDGRCLYGAKVVATPGLYEVTLTISDPTPWVALKERPGLSEKHVWKVRVR